MKKELYLPTAIVLVALVASFTVLTAMGKEVPQWLGYAIQTVLGVVAGALGAVVQKKEEPKSEN